MQEVIYISKKNGKKVSMTDNHYKLLLPSRQKEFVRYEQPIQVPAEYGRSYQQENKKQVKIGKRGSGKIGGSGTGRNTD